MTNLIPVRGVLLSVFLQMLAAPFAMSAQVPEAPWRVGGSGIPLPYPLFPTVEGACGFLVQWLDGREPSRIHTFDHVYIHDPSSGGDGGGGRREVYCWITSVNVATGETAEGGVGLISRACDSIGARWTPSLLGCTCALSETYYPVSEPTDPNHPYEGWACFPYLEKDQTRKPPSCKSNPGYGNPIFPLMGTKREFVRFSQLPRWKPFDLTYDIDSARLILNQAAYCTGA